MADMHPGLKVLMVVLGVIGLLAVIAGIMYLAMPAKSLPSFFPAHLNPAKAVVKHDFAHAMKHGYAALVVGLVLIAAAVAPSLLRRRARPAAQAQGV